MGPGLHLTRAREKEKMGKARSKLGMESLKDSQSTGLAVLATTRGTGSGRMGTIRGRSGTLTSAAAAEATTSCARLWQEPAALSASIASAAGPPLSAAQAKPVSAAAPLQPEVQLQCPWQASSPKTDPVRTCELGNTTKETGCYGALAPYFDGKARTDH